MKKNEAPQKDGAVVILVIGNGADNRPGFLALDLNTGDTFERYTRALNDGEATSLFDEFSVWKAARGGSVTVVELNRGAAAMHFLREMNALPEMGVSHVDLTSMFVGVSCVTGEKLDPNTRMHAELFSLQERARQLGLAYQHVIRMYAELAEVFTAARRINLVYQRESEALG